MMRILALDPGKYKTVGCEYEAETGRHRFATVLTTPKALHDLIVDRAPQRVVIEICSIAGWVGDLVRRLGIELQVANTTPGRDRLFNESVAAKNRVARSLSPRSAENCWCDVGACCAIKLRGIGNLVLLSDGSDGK